MTLLQAYLWMASIISIWGFLRLGPARVTGCPGERQGAVDHVGGSVIAGIAFGWFVWPFLLWALVKRGRLALFAIIIFVAFSGTSSALTPPERKLVLHAQAELNAAIAERAAGKVEVEQAHIETKNANDAALLAATSASTAGDKLKTAEDKARQQDADLIRLRELEKKVSGPWWFPGFNALLYGIKKCTISLLVIIAAVVVIGILLKIFAPGALTAIGVAGKAVKGFGGTAIASAKRLLPKRKPKPPTE